MIPNINQNVAKSKMYDKVPELGTSMWAMGGYEAIANYGEGR